MNGSESNPLPMAKASVAREIEHTPGGIDGRVFGDLLVVLGLATILFVLVLLLAYATWKAAVAAEILAVGAAVAAWRRRFSCNLAPRCRHRHDESAPSATRLRYIVS